MAHETPQHIIFDCRMIEPRSHLELEVLRSGHQWPCTPQTLLSYRALYAAFNRFFSSEEPRNHRWHERVGSGKEMGDKAPGANGRDDCASPSSRHRECYVSQQSRRKSTHVRTRVHGEPAITATRDNTIQSTVNSVGKNATQLSLTELELVFKLSHSRKLMLTNI